MMQRKAEGIHVGSPRYLRTEVLDRIATDRASGISLGKIAAALNADGISTAHGGLQRHASTVSGVLSSLA
jgi:hypothetical protein